MWTVEEDGADGLVVLCQETNTTQHTAHTAHTAHTPDVYLGVTSATLGPGGVVGGQAAPRDDRRTGEIHELIVLLLVAVHALSGKGDAGGRRAVGVRMLVLLEDGQTVVEGEVRGHPSGWDGRGRRVSLRIMVWSFSQFR